MKTKPNIQVGLEPGESIVRPDNADSLRKFLADPITGSLNPAVNHPRHYGGDVPYEPIKVIREWQRMNPLINYDRAAAVKYLYRAGIKSRGLGAIEDLKKAIWHLQSEIDKIAAELKRGVDECAEADGGGNPY